MARATPRMGTFYRSAAAAILAGLIWIGCSQDQTGPTAPGSPLEILSQDLRPAINVQERHTDRLMDIPGVVGTAVSLSEDGRPQIKIFTADAQVEGLPESLDGLPVAVEVTGMFYARSDPTARFDRPVPIGVSTGHPDITAGTIGARVKDALGNVYALSNNHVYANANDANLDDIVIQPGTFDGGVSPNDEIGRLDSFVPIDFSGGNNTVDAAIAFSSKALLGNSTPADDGYGTPSSTTVAAFVGQSVKKYGRTTKLTQGQVAEINVTVDVCYEVVFIWCIKLARFVGQVGISPRNFSGGGDSGSLIVTEAGNNPVGLLFAGSDTRTLANPIEAVLSTFGVTIDDAPDVPPGPVTDIAVTDVSAPASATQGDDVSVDVTVTNAGNQDVTDDINVTLTDDTDGVTIGTQTISGGLTAGASTTLTYLWGTAAASIGDHTLTGSHDFSDDNAGNNSNGATVTIDEEPAPAATTHVGDLDSYNSSEGGTWSAYVIVKVEDSNHNPIEGATVFGSWRGGGIGSDECVTDYAGECLLVDTLIRIRKRSVTFKVTNVVYGTLTYVAGDNHDPDGDSNGTSIKVSRP